MSSEFLRGEWRRGVALGLWILAGLAFLSAALFPLSAGAGIAGPVLLALAAGWTTVATSVEAGKREREGDTFTLSRFRFLALVGAFFVLAISLTIIRDGDQRSFWYVAGVTLVALTISRGRESAGRSAGRRASMDRVR